jgi:alkanesulfonate monooxygenase SsuD/methylene tetrahydromethanopterin reductase-like flavin-dependent oxidoreductase (luciferase family)
MIRIGVNPGQWGWQFEALEHSWQQAEGLGFDAISCFDHVAAAPRGWAAWDAPSLLTAIALRTERAAVCVNVINASLRHPLLLAGQLAVAQAASRGRLEVGLGAGAAHLAPYDFEALGQTFAPPERRREVLAHLLEALPALWRGETVTDSTLDLQDASLGPIGIPIPPLIVGGRSRPLLELAAATRMVGTLSSVTHASSPNWQSDSTQSAQQSAALGPWPVLHKSSCRGWTSPVCPKWCGSWAKQAPTQPCS